MYRIFYRLIAGLVPLTVRSGRSKDLGIIVLRHQLRALDRQIDRPALNNTDRTMLGAIAASLEGSYPEAGAGTGAPGPVVGVRDPACVERKAAAADTFRQSFAEALKLGGPLVDPFQPFS